MGRQARSSRAKWFIGGALTSALALSSGAALAQTAVQDTKLGEGTGSNQTTAPLNAENANQIPEIVVTAQKRSENIQKTPITITAVTGQQLQSEHIEELADIGSLAPGIQLITISQTVQISARGVGSNFFDPRAQPSVSQSIDGLYYTRPPQSGSTFFDVSRVEVLEGPQGTLYGTNSVGGAFNLITNQPTNHFEAYGEAGFGNYSERDYAVTLNVPITDDLAVRVAGKGLFHDGYVADYYDDSNDNSARASLKWTPNSKFTAFLSYNFSEFNGHGSTPVSYPCDSTPYSNVVSPQCAPPGNPGGTYSLTGQASTALQTTQLNLTYDLGWATLTSITGHLYQNQQANDLPNGTFFQSYLSEHSTDNSEEFRIAGNGAANHAGGLSWLAGFYYSGGNGGQYFKALGAPQILTRIPESNYAGFTQETYAITDRIRVTGGIRYTHDEHGTLDSSGSNISISDDHVNFRAEAETDLTSQSLLYASISTGYSAGGVDGGSLSVPTPPGYVPSIFKPETITAYEVGSKNTFLDRRLLLNGSFYYYVIKDFQSYDPGFLNTATGTALEVQNVGNPTIYGADFNAAFAITPVDRLTASLSLAHGTFGPLTLDEFAPGPTGFHPLLISVPAGYPVNNLPPWDIHLSYFHVWHFSTGDSLNAGVNSHISGPYWTVLASTDPLDKQRTFTKTDLNLRYTSHTGFAIEAYVKNIENNATTAYGESPGFHLYYPEAPRTYGMTVSYSFR